MKKITPLNTKVKLIMTQSKAEIIKALKEQEWILKILENAVEKSDFIRDTDYCKALLTRVGQIINQLSEIRKQVTNKTNVDLLKKTNRLIDYYQDFIEQKAEDWGKLTN